MDRDDDGETSYNTFVDDVALEPTYLQALPTAAGRNVATVCVIEKKTCQNLGCIPVKFPTQNIIIKITQKYSL